jgi:hypothetical protein
MEPMTTLWSVSDGRLSFDLEIFMPKQPHGGTLVSSHGAAASINLYLQRARFEGMKNFRKSLPEYLQTTRCMLRDARHDIEAAFDNKRWGIKKEVGDEHTKIPSNVVERRWKTEDDAAWSMLHYLYDILSMRAYPCRRTLAFMGSVAVHVLGKQVHQRFSCASLYTT